MSNVARLKGANNEHMILQAENSSSNSAALLGVFDFSYQHYALGDLLTNQIDLAVIAIERGLRHVDLMVMVNPERPSARQQTFVSSSNSIAHLDNIVSVLLLDTMLRSFTLVRDMQTFNFLF